MKLSATFLMILTLLVFQSCFLDDSSSGSSSTEYTTCSYTEDHVHDVGVDVTTDFDESNVDVEITVNNVGDNCGNLYDGYTATTSMDRVRRVSTLLSIESNGETLNISDSTTSPNTPSENLEGCISGHYVKMTLDSVDYDGGTNEVSVGYSTTITMDSCFLKGIEDNFSLFRIAADRF